MGCGADSDSVEDSEEDGQASKRATDAVLPQCLVSSFFSRLAHTENSMARHAVSPMCMTIASPYEMMITMVKTRW